MSEVPLSAALNSASEMPSAAPAPPVLGGPFSEYRGAVGGSYLQLFYQQLVGQYKTLAGSSRQQPAFAEAVNIVDGIDPEKITWPDVYRLEIALLRLMPLEELRRKAWSLRREFADIAGESRFAAYLASNPPDAAKASDVELRADLVQVLQEIQWLYTVLPTQETVRSTLARQTLKVTAGFLVVLTVLWGIAWIIIHFPSHTQAAERHPGTLSLVITLAMGALGGLISTLRRIQNSPLGDNIVADLITASQTSVSVFVSPLVGAVFAVLLLMMLRGDLISGDLFPKFVSHVSMTAVARTSEINFVLGELMPEDGPSYAKLIVWTFIAGFAEQLVPDALSRLSASATIPPKTKT